MTRSIREKIVETRRRESLLQVTPTHRGRYSVQGGGGFNHILDHIGTKWDKSGTFKDQFSVHFGSSSQNVPKTDL